MPADVLRKVCELEEWARSSGDDDVVRVCERAQAGDHGALEEALDWYDVWSGFHRPAAKGGVS